MIDDILSMVHVLKAQAQADIHYGKKCFNCGEFIVYVEAMGAVAPGHVYSRAGMDEYGISKTCEFCFDAMFAPEEDEEDMTELVDNPMPGQITAIVPDLDSSDSQHVEDPQRYEIEMNLDKADVITSVVANKFGRAIHRPVIDVDFPVTAVPSSSPGHSHLYIDKELTWGQYQKLLEVMVEIGLVEPGYLGASRVRGFTAVRKPGKLKPGVRVTNGNQTFDQLLDLQEPAPVAPWDSPVTATRKPY